MLSFKEQAMQAADFLRQQITATPLAAVLTGTGLGNMTASMAVETSFAYEALPHFPLSTVRSHAGRLDYGRWAGQPVMVMQGRFHLYEGYSAVQVSFPVRVLQELGVPYLILSNAAGGLNLNYTEGDIMIIRDHINLTGENPLIGPNEASWGERFPDMTSAWDPHLGDLAEKAALQDGISIQNGIYVGLKGPSLETPAEVRFLRQIGADAVGLSTVMENISAVHAGMRTLGLSTITNINDPDRPRKASLEAIINVAQAAAPKLDKIIQSVLSALPELHTSEA